MKIMRFALATLFWLGLLEVTPATDWYVATNGTGGGTSWALATNSLQGAIDASSAGDTVWVSNGLYAVGGVTNWPSGGLLTNRVAISKAITVRSTNGPAVTTIKGDRDPATNGPAAVRCVYMANNSSLIGFTLTNGATFATGVNDSYGGGIFSPLSGNTSVSNCVITGNAAVYGGGAIWVGTFYNCTLSGNSAQTEGGGVYASTFYNCTLSGNSAQTEGGGARNSTLNNCTLSSNSANSGGGTSASTLNNCTLSGNSALNGGGARYGTLNNCTLSSNSATAGGGTYDSTLYNCTLSGNSASSAGGGARDSTLYNCTITGNSSVFGGGVYADAGLYINSIIYFNSAPNGSNWAGAAVFTNSCTTTAAVDWATGNITNDPLFMANGSGYGTNHVAGNYRLSANSPCLNAGTNFSWMTNTNDVRSRDLDGQPRIRDQIVDMGAYEKLLEGTIFYFR